MYLLIKNLNNKSWKSKSAPAPTPAPSHHSRSQGAVTAVTFTLTASKFSISFPRSLLSFIIQSLACWAQRLIYNHLYFPYPCLYLLIWATWQIEPIHKPDHQLSFGLSIFALPVCPLPVCPAWLLKINSCFFFLFFFFSTQPYFLLWSHLPLCVWILILTEQGSLMREQSL